MEIQFTAVPSPIQMKQAGGNRVLGTIFHLAQNAMCMKFGRGNPPDGLRGTGASCFIGGRHQHHTAAGSGCPFGRDSRAGRLSDNDCSQIINCLKGVWKSDRKLLMSSS